MLPRSALVLAILTALTLAAPSPAMAFPGQQEEGGKKPEDTKKDEAAASQQAPTPGQEAPAQHEEKQKTKMANRLRLTVGPAYYQLSARGRGMTHPRHHDPVTLLTIEQTTDLKFDPATGGAVAGEATFEIIPRLFARADYLFPQIGDTDFMDRRLIGRFDGPGDFKLAQFNSSGSTSRYLEFSFGGYYRLLPGKKKLPNSPIFVDAFVNYRKAAYDNHFEVGHLTENPFDPNSLRPGNFDILGLQSGNYSMDFESIQGGLRVGGKLSERLSMEGTISNVFFGRFEGQSEVPRHGLLFVHDPYQHISPAWHTSSGCNSVDDPNLQTPTCGMVDADVRWDNYKTRQKSSHARGLGLNLNLEYKVLEWMGLVAGYDLQTFRSVGGEETRSFRDDAALGCPTDSSGHPACDETGDLVKAEVMRQGLYVMGRFRFF